jgi:hypothetical protein
MKLVLICGPWGSGTTAVAGMIEKLGAHGFGPYYHTGDPRTPNSFELIAFKESVRRLASDRIVGPIPGAAKTALMELRRLHSRIELQEFGPHDPNGSVPIFFKDPISAFLLPQICNVFDTRFVYVVRSLEDIERTRARRGWPTRFGRVGAEIIYRVLKDFEKTCPNPILTLQYADLLSSPAKYARVLASFSGLEPNSAQLIDAANFVSPEVKSESISIVNE